VPRILRRVVAVPCVAIAFAAAALSAPVPAAGGSSPELVTAVNAHRIGAGVPAVAWHSAVERTALERSTTVATTLTLAHDFDALGVRLAELGVCADRYGEILLVEPTLDVARFAEIWMSSAPHRQTMLDPAYAVAGGAHSIGVDGRHYAVVVFVDPCDAPAFGDTAGSAFEPDIAWLVAAGITNGCGEGSFCPTSPVTRAQMASFLKRAIGLPPPGGDHFWDDLGSVHEDDINRVAEAAITHGCGGGAYCPHNVVTRDQMASFLVRALRLPSTTTDYFWDDAASAHEDDINRLAAAGVTTGCGGGAYCPGGSVTREQMAAFLHRAFD
jgi:hypothetical protein